MKLLLGVNVGSIIEPSLLVIEDKASTSKEKFAYVGIGINYDTGDIKNKIGNFIRQMK